LDIEKDLRKCGAHIRNLTLEEKELRERLQKVTGGKSSWGSRSYKQAFFKNAMNIFKTSAAVFGVLFAGMAVLLLLKGGMSSGKWADVFTINDIHYRVVYEYNNALGTNEKLMDKNQADLTRVVGKIKRNTQKMLFKSAKYQMRNGDAVFLNRGTKIYGLKEYDPKFRVAAYKEGSFILYEAVDNPKARTGRDVLDLEDKVIGIIIRDGESNRTELGRIEDEELIEKLVNMILQAPFVKAGWEEPAYAIQFLFKDASETTRYYQKNTGVLAQGIITPQEFGEEINKVINK
jgi:hypothetical protein